jgi:Mechanosensitive ion channel, conserved TM helix
MSQTWQNILNSLGDWTLKVVGFLAIMVVGWIIARILGNVVNRVLARVGFNRLAERSGFRRWTGSYQPSGLVGRLVYYAALLFVFQIAFNVFGPNPVSDLIHTIIAWLPRLLIAAVIMVVAIAIANAVFDIITNALAQFSYGRALGRIAQVLIVGLGVIAALGQIGVATTVTTPILIATLATIGGILIVGVGGGLVRPMQERWERMLSRAESETTRVATVMRERPDRTMKPEGDRMTQPAYQGREPQAARDLKTPAEQAREQAEH